MTTPSAPGRYRQIVGAAVLDSLTRPSHLLVARRSAPPHLAGRWEFPGGKVESGESCEDAVGRELEEELGVRVRLGAEITGPHPQGWPLNGTAAMRVWLSEITEGEAAPLQDHDDLRWVPLDPPEEVEALPWIVADRPILVALRAVLAAGTAD